MELSEKSFSSELMRVFKACGMGALLNMERCEKLYRLTVHMLTENEKYNLTAIKDPDGIILNHYADCATLATRIAKGASVIDVGCGAGFPTLPLALFRPDLKITALDSTAKRVSYVSGCAELLSLDSVRAVCMRAEDGARLPELRESFDVATARAVAELRVLAELCLPYVKVGGKLIAMKGKNAEFELTSAKAAIAILGGKAGGVETVSLTNGKGDELTHPLIIIDKKNKTPAAYPRAYAQISKKPL